MNAREQILGRLRAHRPAAPVSAPEVAAWYAAHRPVTPMAERVERLCAGLELAHAEVHRVTPENWVDRLAEVLQARALTTLLVGRDTAHGARAAEALAARGVMCPGYGQAIEHWKERLFHEVPAALTAEMAAAAAIFCRCESALMFCSACCSRVSAGAAAPGARSAVFSAAAMVAVLSRALLPMAALSACSCKSRDSISGIFCRLFAG